MQSKSFRASRHYFRVMNEDSLGYVGKIKLSDCGCTRDKNTHLQLRLVRTTLLEELQLPARLPYHNQLVVEVESLSIQRSTPLEI